MTQPNINIDFASLIGKKTLATEKTKRLNKRLKDVLASKGIKDEDAYMESIKSVSTEQIAPDVYISGNVFAMLGLISNKK